MLRKGGLLLGLILCCSCDRLLPLRKSSDSTKVVESAWKSARYQEPRAQGRRALQQGDFVAAEAAYLKGRQMAENNQDWGVAARFATNIANTQLARGLRQEVAPTLYYAEVMARRQNDLSTVAAATISLANLQLAQNNWQAAEELSQRLLQEGTPLPPKLRLALLATLSRAVGELRGAPAAFPALSLCIEQGQLLDSQDLEEQARTLPAGAPLKGTGYSREAEFWDMAGHLFLQSKDWDRAEAALNQSYRLRLAAKDPRLHWLYERFTRLAIGRKQWQRGERWLQLSARNQRSVNAGVDWVWSVLAGQIAEGKGETAKALQAYRQAWQQAKRWRQGAVVQEDALVNTEVQVQQAADGFLRLAGQQLLLAGSRAGNPLAAEAFTIAEESRAWSIMLQAKGWLPPAAPPVAGEAVLLFALGKELSHRWDWTSRGLRWTPLPPQHQLLPLLAAANRELQSGAQRPALAPSLAPSAAPASRKEAASGNAPLWPKESAVARLSRLLLQGAPAEPHWRVIPDQELFALPFAALQTAEGNLVLEQHDVALVPCLRLPRQPLPQSAPAFLGAGDFVFNRADDRWQNLRPASGAALVHAAGTPSQELIRLIGSAREVRSLQQMYAATGAPVRSLTGTASNRSRLEWELTSRKPAVLHMATHAIEADAGRSIWLALGLSPQGEMEYWTASRVATLEHAPALVMLNACASGHAQALPGAGLLGMSRAWLLAGAQDVVLSSWALPDDDGEFARLFHQEFLQRLGQRHAAPTALRAAQLACLRSTGFRAAPRYWAAFFVTSTYAKK